MDEYSMTVVIQTESYSALTPPSMTRKTSLTYDSLVYSVTNIAVAFSLKRNWQTEIEPIGRLTT